MGFRRAIPLSAPTLHDRELHSCVLGEQTHRTEEALSRTLLLLPSSRQEPRGTHHVHEYIERDGPGIPRWVRTTCQARAKGNNVSLRAPVPADSADFLLKAHFPARQALHLQHLPALRGQALEFSSRAWSLSQRSVEGLVRPGPTTHRVL